MHIERFEIEERFHGPPRSGNGGYTCGRVAQHMKGIVAARLRAPPPLNTELQLETDAQSLSRPMAMVEVRHLRLPRRDRPA